MRRIVLLVVMGILFAAQLAQAGWNYVTPVDFKQWLETGKKMKIVDIQVHAEFAKHHVKGALETNAFPVKSAEEKEKLDRVLPMLKAGQEDIVVICPRGGGGAKNTCDYLKAKGVAEKRLFILQDGMQGWPYKQLAVSGAQ